MQIYVLSSTLAQKYGRICVNDIGRNTGKKKKKKKKTCLRVIAFLKRGESVIKFAGCGNFNIVGRSRAETRCDVSRVSSRRHLTGK